MLDLIVALEKLAKELRKPEISYTNCDKLRIEIDALADSYRTEIDDVMLYRKIKNIGYDYHMLNLEYTASKYGLIGRIYWCIDLLKAY